MTTHVIAVAVDDIRLYGCPSCGHTEGFMPVVTDYTTAWICGRCQTQTFALTAGVTVSTLAAGDGSYPQLQLHPRRPPTVVLPFHKGGG